MIRFRRIPVLLLTAATLCAALSAGCAAKIDLPSKKKDPSRMTPSELQQFVSTQAALAGANAGIDMTQLPTAPLPPEVPQIPPPGVTPAITAPERTTFVATRTVSNEVTRRTPPALQLTKITSVNLHERPEDARSDALRVAASKIMERLQQLDPPIVMNISPNKVWNEYAVQSTAGPVDLPPGEIEVLKESKAGANRVRYQLDVEISEPQLRELRAEGRIKNIAAPIVFGGLVVAGLASIFLRVTGAAAAVVRRG